VSEEVNLFSVKSIKNIKGLGYVIIDEIKEKKRPIPINEPEANKIEEPLRLGLY
jgi:hypothetical protein